MGRTLRAADRRSSCVRGNHPRCLRLQPSASHRVLACRAPSRSFSSRTTSVPPTPSIFASPFVVPARSAARGFDEVGAAARLCIPQVSTMTKWLLNAFFESSRHTAFVERSYSTRRNGSLTQTTRHTRPCHEAFHGTAATRSSRLVVASEGPARTSNESSAISFLFMMCALPFCSPVRVGWEPRPMSLTSSALFQSAPFSLVSQRTVRAVHGTRRAKERAACGLRRNLRYDPAVVVYNYSRRCSRPPACPHWNYSTPSASSSGPRSVLHSIRANHVSVLSLWRRPSSARQYSSQHCPNRVSPALDCRLVDNRVSTETGRMGLARRLPLSAINTAPINDSSDVIHSIEYPCKPRVRFGRRRSISFSALRLSPASESQTLPRPTLGTVIIDSMSGTSDLSRTYLPTVVIDSTIPRACTNVAGITV